MRQMLYLKWATKAKGLLSTLHLLVKGGGVKVVGPWITPILFDKVKLAGIDFVLSTLSESGSREVAVDIRDEVVVDENWLYVLREGGKIHLHPNEDSPNLLGHKQAGHHDNHVSGGCGHALVHPIGYCVMARSASLLSLRPCRQKRSNKNCAAGATVIRPVNMVMGKYKGIINDVIPAIKARMPGALTCPIFIQLQQDGTKSHS
ncbi:unnamed protein product [Discosporangium mesarthrocarpum]